MHVYLKGGHTQTHTQTHTVIVQSTGSARISLHATDLIFKRFRCDPFLRRFQFSVFGASRATPVATSATL